MNCLGTSGPPLLGNNIVDSPGVADNISCEFVAFLDSLLQKTERLAIMFLQVSFDGSWKGEYAAYAGIAGGNVAVDDFNARWMHVRMVHLLPYLRMTEAMNWGGAWRPRHETWGADRDRKRAIALGEFVGAAKASRVKAIGCATNVAHLEGNTPAIKKKLLFQRAVTDLLACVPAPHQIALVCDTEHDAADEFRRWLVNLQTKNQDARRIVGLCLMDDKAVQILQIADMAAYLFREEIERQETQPRTSANPLFHTLVGNCRVDTAHVLLGRFLDPNAFD